MNYKIRDKARDMYRQGWHLFEIENKLGISCTEYVIPRWMRDQRNKREIELQKEEAKARKKSLANRIRYEKELDFQEKERRRKLRKVEAKRIKAMAKKIQRQNAINTAKKHKECPINNLLMRAW